jgi:signal transduction histidine kinase
VEKIQSASDFDTICTIMRENMPRLRYDRARLYLREGNYLKGVSSVVVPWNTDFGAFDLNIQKDPPSLILMKHKCPLIFRVLPEGDKRIGTIKNITGGKIVYTDKDSCKEKLNIINVDEWLEIPLITADEIIGKISIDNNESQRPIDEYDLPMMGLFGRYTANAIWNVRTHSELRNRAKQRQEEQEILRKADAEILKSLRLQEMLNAILQEAKKLVPFDCAIIRQWDEYSRKFILKARKGKYRGRIPIYVEEDIGISEECANKKRTVVANNLRRLSAYRKLLESTKAPKEKEFLEWTGSGVAVPLMIGGRLIGILTVMKHIRNGFQNKERIILLEDFANRAAIALQYTELFEANANFIDFEAHALKNRIQPIKSCVELLLDSNINTDDYKELCEILDSELVRLSNTVNNILYTAQDREDGLIIKREPVDVQKLIEETVRAFKLVAEDSGYQIKAEIEEGIGSPSFDKNKVFDAIVSLVDNAIKYSEGTEIVISASLDKNFLTFSVSDNGKGIETEEQKKVFDKFYRTEAVKDRVDGSGIGLAVVKSVAEAHGGRAWLESILIRKGTKVYMTLSIE